MDLGYQSMQYAMLLNIFKFCISIVFAIQFKKNTIQFNLKHTAYMNKINPNDHDDVPINLVNIVISLCRVKISGWRTSISLHIIRALRSIPETESISWKTGSQILLI